MLPSMDGDVFGEVTKLGRAAADAVARALRGEPPDLYLAKRCLDALVAAAGGIPSLRVVLSELEQLREAPLFARFCREGALGRIRDASGLPGCTELDLVLRRNAERCLCRGELGARPLLERFFQDLLDRAVLTGRRGFIEEYGSSELEQARAVLAPVVAEAAAALAARPRTTRLGLAKPCADVTPETNLLEGVR